MGSLKNISLVFGLIIVLLAGLGGISLSYLNAIAKETENLYHHPYTVSNATRDIEINLISMHRYMEDIALAENEEQIKKATAQVNTYEQAIVKDFELVFERYLGKRGDIKTAYTAFIDWKTIREEVIFLKMAGKDKEAAAITRTEAADHIKRLNIETRKLIDFADNKAKSFLVNSIQAKKRALTLISGLLVITVVISIFISTYAVRRLSRAQKDTKQRMHLIDQNILTAKLDTNGEILDISNRLCRYLGLTKSQARGKQSHFFTETDPAGVTPADILRITSTGTRWEGEIKRINSNGKIQWMKSIIHPDLDGDYNVIGYNNIIHDISATKLLEELSLTDNLTKLYNRRHFDETLEKEIKIARRQDNTLTLAIIDIDHFKKYNDLYGHPEGDATLASVAKTLKQSINRPNDYAFRLGGEEFALLFSELSPDQAENFLEDIRKRVEDLNIDHRDNTVSDCITISIGAHTSQGAYIPDADQLYLMADRALYNAKTKRNHVSTQNAIPLVKTPVHKLRKVSGAA